MRSALLLLVLSMATAGCAGWTAKDYAAQVATFGMYGLFVKGPRDNAEAWGRYKAAEVDKCFSQGGDPAACRQAIYGSGGVAPQPQAPQGLGHCWRVRGDVFCNR